jgi:hypothetical protein
MYRVPGHPLSRSSRSSPSIVPWPTLSRNIKSGRPCTYTLHRASPFPTDARYMRTLRTSAMSRPLHYILERIRHDYSYIVLTSFPSHLYVSNTFSTLYVH